VDQAKTTLREARDRAGTSLSEGRKKAAEQIGEVGGALHRAGERLRGESQPRLADAADTIGRQANRAADYLREKDGKAIARDVESYTRRRPGVALAGAFLLGVVLSRILGRRS
jgi:ElaB/YqjD/DUF883 family membrane-anchored ribosome-binding protein